NRDAGREKLRLTDKVRSRLAQFFKNELQACATKLGGPAKEWPARYGFLLVLFFIGLGHEFATAFLRSGEHAVASALKESPASLCDDTGRSSQRLAGAIWLLTGLVLNRTG